MRAATPASQVRATVRFICGQKSQTLVGRSSAAPSESRTLAGRASGKVMAQRSGCFQLAHR